MELPLVFNFTKTSTGFEATMDSPKQGVKGIPVDEVTFITKKLGNELAVKLIQALDYRLKELTDNPMLLNMLCDWVSGKPQQGEKPKS